MTGGAAAASASRVSTSSDNEVTSALDELMLFLRSGGKADILILLMATALIPSICKNWLKMSPILGFLAAGTLLGPNMLNVIGDTHTGEEEEAEEEEAAAAPYGATGRPCSTRICWETVRMKSSRSMSSHCARSSSRSARKT